MRLLRAVLAARRREPRGGVRPPRGASPPPAARILLAAALSLPAGGCMIARYTEGYPIARDRVADIQRGVTTREQILAWFGPPRGYTSDTVLRSLVAEPENSDGFLDPSRLPDVLAYEFAEGEARGVLLLLFNYVRARVDSDRLVVFFDDEDRVLYYGFHERAPASD
jgi:hypothetical protein